MILTAINTRIVSAAACEVIIAARAYGNEKPETTMLSNRIRWRGYLSEPIMRNPRLKTQVKDLATLNSRVTFPSSRVLF